MVRARQEHERAPCVENSFSRKRQINVVVAAAPSSVVFSSNWHWTAGHPPLLINYTTPARVLYHLRRCSVFAGIATTKISGDQRWFFYTPPAKLAITLLSQPPCVTGASPTKNTETPALSRLASIFELSQDAAHDNTTNRAASTAAI